MSTTGQPSNFDSGRQEPLTPDDFEELTVYELERPVIGDLGKEVIWNMFEQLGEAESYADAA